MSIDDPIEVYLAQVKQDLDSGIEGELTSVTVAGILSMIPGAGAAIQSLLDGKARANVERRWLELFVALRKRIEEVRDQIPDMTFYGSEEFQTLLALAQEQLWTTHESQKLNLLAAALANSGTETCRKDDKELMLRALRAITPADLDTLNHEYLKGWLPLTKRIDYRPDVLGSLARLASQGLVMEKFLRPNPNTTNEQKLASLLEHGTWRTFQLSPFGERFLKFVEGGDTNQPSS